jgi:hypothetical protein
LALLGFTATFRITITVEEAGIATGDRTLAADAPGGGVIQLTDLIASATVVDIGLKVEVLVDQTVAVIVEPIAKLLLRPRLDGGHTLQLSSHALQRPGLTNADMARVATLTEPWVGVTGRYRRGRRRVGCRRGWLHRRCGRFCSGGWSVRSAGCSISTRSVPGVARDAAVALDTRCGPIGRHRTAVRAGTTMFWVGQQVNFAAVFAGGIAAGVAEVAYDRAETTGATVTGAIRAVRTIGRLHALDALAAAIAIVATSLCTATAWRGGDGGRIAARAVIDHALVVRIEDVGVIVLRGNAARTVTDILLAIADGLDGCRRTGWLETEAAASLSAGPSLAFSVLARALGGGAAFRRQVRALTGGAGLAGRARCAAGAAVSGIGIGVSACCAAESR